MNIEPRLLGVNFAKGRTAKTADVIVIHIMEGTLVGTDAWFNNPESKVSAHYGVAKDGSVVQWVKDEDTAWHAGTVKDPTAAIVKERAGINPNVYSYGIECEGHATEEPPAAQLDGLAALVRHLVEKHDIPLTVRHVIGHRQIRADKTCPGKIDMDEVIERAKGLAPPKNVVRDALAEIRRQVALIEATLPGG